MWMHNRLNNIKQSKFKLPKPTIILVMAEKFQMPHSPVLKRKEWAPVTVMGIMAPMVGMEIPDLYYQSSHEVSESFSF